MRLDYFGFLIDQMTGGYASDIKTKKLLVDNDLWNSFVGVFTLMNRKIYYDQSIDDNLLNTYERKEEII